VKVKVRVRIRIRVRVRVRVRVRTAELLILKFLLCLWQCQLTMSATPKLRPQLALPKVFLP
jgi:hypothetical protein